MLLAKVGYSIVIESRKRQGLPESDGRRNCWSKGIAPFSEARRRFAGGDTSAGRLGITRKMSWPPLLFRKPLISDPNEFRLRAIQISGAIQEGPLLTILVRPQMPLQEPTGKVAFNGLTRFDKCIVPPCAIMDRDAKIRPQSC